MKKMSEFIKTEKNGTLFYDKILFETYIPILFICRNERKELFVCVCCRDNADGKKWLISKTKASTIASMLKNEMAIRDVFLKDSSDRISVDVLHDNIKIEYNNSDWKEESDFLPKKGAYIDAEPGEYDEEIEYYQKWKSFDYLSQYYAGRVEVIKGFSETTSASMEILDTVISDVFTSVITSEVMQTIKETDTIHLASLIHDMGKTSDNFQCLFNEGVEIKKYEMRVEINNESASLLDAA